jgi:signal transduction histidine kinase/ActR/RegA family two-component response regulator
MSLSSDDSDDGPWQVLVVHDSAAVLGRIRKALEEAPGPVEVYEAGGQLEAHEVLRTAKPTCVLAASRLPDGSCLELAHEWADIPFVAISIGASDDDRLDLVSRGVEDVLESSEIDPNMIYRSIRYAVGRKLHSRAMEALAHRDRLLSLGQLSANVAHEINNPLAYLMANLEALSLQVVAAQRLLRVLRDDPEVSSAYQRAVADHPLPFSGEETESIIEDSLDGAQRIASIVKQLGAFARGSEDESPSETSLSDVVARACELIRKRVEEHAELVIECEDDTPFMGRAGRLVQVVTNLLFNAAQAVPADRPTENTVWVRTTSDPDAVHLIVEDTGPGFTWRVRRRAFEPFFTTKSAGEGSGLGLAIVHDIVRGHGGSISLDNRTEGGARVVVSIPRETGLGAASEPRRSSIAPASSGDAFRILLVDDEPSIRRSYARMLEPHEVVGLTASEALERVSAQQDQAFDLVLCDVTMPDIDGFTFLRRLEEAAPTLSDRFVFLTGGALDDEVRDALQRSATQVLSKPATKKDILKLAREARAEREAEDAQVFSA